MKNNIKRLFLLALLFISGTALAYDNPDKIMLIEPGMSKEEAIQIIGPPDSVVSKAVDGKGVTAEVYKYNYAPPPADPKAVGDLFIKPEFSRDAQNVSTQEAAAEQMIISHPSYTISFLNNVVESVNKAG